MSPVQCVTDVPVHSLPLAAFAVVLVFAFQPIRAGIAGRNRPAEEGRGGCTAAAAREETSSQLNALGLEPWQGGLVR
jgi:hypothetical protein